MTTTRPAASFTTSQAQRERTKRREGYRDTPYADAAGCITVGWGHRCIGAPPPKITKDQAEMLFDRDISVAEVAVRKLVRVEITQGIFDALVDFTFNLGAAAINHSTLLALLNAGDAAGARAQLLRWTHAGGKELTGLVARRDEEWHVWAGIDPGEDNGTMPPPKQKTRQPTMELWNMQTIEIVLTLSRVIPEMITLAKQAAATVQADEPEGQKVKELIADLEKGLEDLKSALAG